MLSPMLVSILTSALLPASCFADPFSLWSRHLNTQDDLNNKHELCHTHDLSVDNAGSWSVIWDDTQADIYLDWYLSTKERSDWAFHMQSDSEVWFPNHMQNAAVDPDLCDEFVEHDSGPAYYVLMAASRVNSMLDTLNTYLATDPSGKINAPGTLSRVEDIYELDNTDYNSPPISDRPDSNLPGKLANAFTAAIGDMGLNYRLPLIGIIGSTFGAAGVVQKVADNTKGQGMISRADQLFSAVRSHIGTTKDTIFNAEGVPSMLGGVDLGSDRKDMATDVAKFFGDGRFLLSDWDKVMNDLVDQAFHYARQAVLITSLIEQGYMVFWNTGDHDCGDEDLDTIITIDGKDECFNILMVPEKISDGSAGGEYPGDEVMSMLDEYEIDHIQLFTNAYLCWRDNDGGYMNYQDLWDNHELLPCFYSMPILKSTIEEGGFTEGNLNILDDCDIDQTGSGC